MFTQTCSHFCNNVTILPVIICPRCVAFSLRSLHLPPFCIDDVRKCFRHTCFAHMFQNLSARMVPAIASSWLHFVDVLVNKFNVNFTWDHGWFCIKFCRLHLWRMRLALLSATDYCSGDLCRVSGFLEIFEWQSLRVTFCYFACFSRLCISQALRLQALNSQELYSQEMQFSRHRTLQAMPFTGSAFHKQCRVSTAFYRPCTSSASRSNACLAVRRWWTLLIGQHGF